MDGRLVVKLNEAKRLDALYNLNLLDTPVSESFDRITRMASQIFDLPIAAVSLTDVDRQWFKSRVGVDHQSIPRDEAPCAQVAESADVLVIPDMATDECYKQSVLCKSGIRFYAGAPLITREGYGLGALCVLGTSPRETTPEELAALTDLAAMVMAQVELQHAFGRIDPISGLPNRTQFFDDISDFGQDETVDTHRLAVLIDLADTKQVDHLSRVLGPAEIDTGVREAACFLRAETGRRTAYHISATQFAFVAHDHVGEENYIRDVAAMLTRLEAASSFQFMMTPVAGIAPFGPGIDPADLLRAMGSAAQDARLQGVQVNVFSAKSDDKHRRSFRLLQDFDSALRSDGQLSLVFQPRVSLDTGQCVATEVLLRWLHPELGSISPGEFIPIIENSPHVRDMTSWVLDAALRQARLWKNQGLTVPMSVNISAANLEEEDFVDRIMVMLLRHGILPSLLELEVTESAIMKDAGAALKKLQALAEAGIALSIDDFGTGYSSLSYLQRLPTTVVKIDQSFIRNLGVGDRDENLVRSMIALSHDLGYRVVAEGVESAQAADTLMAMGCDEAQGYLFSKPLNVHALQQWFSSKTGRASVA
ncbi:EAL domain-containing protein (putative c-di-GMP-specific phosphodiesterase class I) [Rhizobium sp. PP-F2F-G36]|nr:EAL domain-containing protein (putative c-di-GMP-specific phosphodiesterase class I) [Rhizobium sp. PP-F2F-G36]